MNAFDFTSGLAICIVAQNIQFSRANLLPPVQSFLSLYCDTCLVVDTML